MNATERFIQVLAAIQAKTGLKNRSAIAKEAGIHYTYLSELATGKVPMTEKTSGEPTATIKKLCSVFGLNADYIIGGTGAIFADEQPSPPTPPSAPEETNRFIAIINRQLDVISKRDEQIDRLLDQTDRMLTLLEKK